MDVAEEHDKISRTLLLNVSMGIKKRTLWDKRRFGWGEFILKHGFTPSVGRFIPERLRKQQKGSLIQVMTLWISTARITELLDTPYADAHMNDPLVRRILAETVTVGETEANAYRGMLKTSMAVGREFGLLLCNLVRRECFALEITIGR